MHVVAHHSVRCLLASIHVYKYPPFFLFWFKFFTIVPLLHQSVKACCIMQSRVHIVSSLLNCAGSYLSHLASSNSASSFAGSFFASRNNWFEKATFVAPPLGCWERSALTWSASFAFVPVHCSSPLLNPSMITLLFT